MKHTDYTDLKRRLQQPQPMFACGYPCSTYQRDADLERKEAADAIEVLEHERDVLMRKTIELSGPVSDGVWECGWNAALERAAKVIRPLSEREEGAEWGEIFEAIRNQKR